MIGCRYRPAGSSCDVPRHRHAVSHVHWDPHSAEVTTSNQAGRLLLVDDQLQRHHHRQRAHSTRTKHQMYHECTSVYKLCPCLRSSLSPVGSSVFIYGHHSQSEQQLSVHFLQQQLRFYGQGGKGTRLLHHRTLPGTNMSFGTFTELGSESLASSWESCQYAFL